MEDRCLSRGVAVDGEVSSGGVCNNCRIGIIRRLGGRRGHIILHACLNQGRVALCQGRHNLTITEAEEKRRSPCKL